MLHTLGTKVGKESGEHLCAASSPPLSVILLPQGHYDQYVVLDLRAPVV